MTLVESLNRARKLAGMDPLSESQETALTEDSSNKWFRFDFRFFKPKSDLATYKKEFESKMSGHKFKKLAFDDIGGGAIRISGEVLGKGTLDTAIVKAYPNEYSGPVKYQQL